MTSRTQAISIPALQLQAGRSLHPAGSRTGEMTLFDQPKRPSLVKMIDEAGEAEGAYDLSLDRDTSLTEDRELL